MAPSSVWVLTVLSLVTNLVDGLAYNGPRATDAGGYQKGLDAGGWSPAPTSAPNVPRLFERGDLVGRDYGSTVLVGRDQRCGYFSQTGTSPLYLYSCLSSSTCHFWPQTSALGVVACCGGGGCRIRTACVDYTDLASCGPDCQSDTHTLKCSNTVVPLCNTLVVGDISVRDVFCDQTTEVYPTQTIHTYYPGQSSSLLSFRPVAVQNILGLEEPTSSTSSTTASTTSPISIVTITDPSTPSPTPPPPPPPAKPIGAIVGGVVGGVAVLAIIAGGIFLIIRKRRNGDQAASTQPTEYSMYQQQMQEQQQRPPTYIQTGHDNNSYAGGKSPMSATTSTFTPIGASSPPPPAASEPSYAGDPIDRSQAVSPASPHSNNGVASFNGHLSTGRDSYMSGPGYDAAYPPPVGSAHEMDGLQNTRK